MLSTLALWGISMVAAGQLGSSEVEVAHRLSDRVFEPGSAPKLVVTVRNGTAEPIRLVRFQSAACFAAAHLGLSLATPAGPAKVAICAGAGDAGTPKAIAPGERESVELDLAALFPKATWAKGSYELSSQWTSPKLPARSQSHGELTFVLAAPLSKFKIAKREEVKLPDGARLKFAAHGHKSAGPDVEIPLMIYGEFAAPGEKAAKEFQVNHFDSEGRSLVLGGGYVFVIDASEYDASMTLRYFGKLQLP